MAGDPVRESADAASPSRRRRRPLAVSLFCLFGWTVICWAAWAIASHWEEAQALEPSVRYAGPAALGVAALALVGYWRMKRWGLWLVGLALVGRVGLTLETDLPLRPGDVVWLAVLAVVGLAYYRQFD